MHGVHDVSADRGEEDLRHGARRAVAVLHGDRGESRGHDDSLRRGEAEGLSRETARGCRVSVTKTNLVFSMCVSVLYRTMVHIHRNEFKRTRDTREGLLNFPYFVWRLPIRGTPDCGVRRICGWRRVRALSRAFQSFGRLRPAMTRLVVHILCGVNEWYQ